MIVIRRLGLKWLILESKSRYYPAAIVSTFENKQELFVLGGGLAVGASIESCELL